MECVKYINLELMTVVGGIQAYEDDERASQGEVADEARVRKEGRATREVAQYKCDRREISPSVTVTLSVTSLF